MGLPVLVGDALQSGFVMAPELKSLSSLHKGLDKTHAEQLFAALAIIHQAGYVTRDVRPTNLMVSLDGKQAFITDFGFATKEGETTIYRGALTTASNRVLEIMSEDREVLVGVTIADERESLVKVCLLFPCLSSQLLNKTSTILVLCIDVDADGAERSSRRIIRLGVLEGTFPTLGQKGIDQCQEWWNQ